MANTLREISRVEQRTESLLIRSRRASTNDTQVFKRNAELAPLDAFFVKATHMLSCACAMLWEVCAPIEDIAHGLFKIKVAIQNCAEERFL
jgi:hypothetical protein